MFDNITNQGSSSALPLQKIADSKKNEKWKKKCILFEIPMFMFMSLTSHQHHLAQWVEAAFSWKA